MATFSTANPAVLTTGPAAPLLFGSGPGSMSYRALRLSGYIMAGTGPESDVLDDCLSECNSMLDGWNALQNAQYFYDDRYFVINVSQQSYTLGPTGTFNTDINGAPLTYRPQRIISANLVLLANVAQPTRIPIRIIPVQEFSGIPVIAVPSQVTIEMYVQTTRDNVTLWMYPFPQTGNQIEFFMWPGFPRFSSLDSVFNGPPGWEDAIVYNLAYRLYMLNSKDLGVASPQRERMLSAMAYKTFRVIEGSNAPTPILVPDLQVTDGANGTGAPFDYLTGYASGQ